MWIDSLLLELGDVLRERPDFKSAALSVLAAHDREHSTAYLPTLRAFAQACWDIGETARSLAMHPNSVRYRLRRLEEISGLALDDPRQRLLLSLQLLTS